MSAPRRTKKGIRVDTRIPFFIFFKSKQRSESSNRLSHGLMTHQPFEKEAARKVLLLLQMYEAYFY